MRRFPSRLQFNWRYALGEVLLIIVGVTIALAGTAWYDQRQERQEELLALRQLRETLADDLESIRYYQQEIDRIDRDIYLLIDHLQSDRPYTAALDEWFGSLGSWRSVNVRTGPFESLKSNGFELISNPAIRARLIAFYEDTHPSLSRNEDIDRDFVRDKVWSYFFVNFSRPNDEQGYWQPLDYEAVRSEPYVLNLCKWRVSSHERFLRRNLVSSVEEIGELLLALDSELAN